MKQRLSFDLLAPQCSSFLPLLSLFILSFSLLLSVCPSFVQLVCCRPVTVSELHRLRGQFLKLCEVNQFRPQSSATPVSSPSSSSSSPLSPSSPTSSSSSLSSLSSPPSHITAIADAFVDYSNVNLGTGDAHNNIISISHMITKTRRSRKEVPWDPYRHPPLLLRRKRKSKTTSEDQKEKSKMRRRTRSRKDACCCWCAQQRGQRKRHNNNRAHSADS